MKALAILRTVFFRGLLPFFLLGFISLGAVLSFHLTAPATSELVVVLGGGGPERFATGLELAKSRKTQSLLLIHPAPGQIKLARDTLGVDGATVFADERPISSWDEAVNSRAWMESNGVKLVLVVSDPPHMLRLWYTWSRVFDGSELHYSLVSTHPAWWSTWRWWANDESRRFVASEVLKLAYYGWHY